MVVIFRLRNEQRLGFCSNTVLDTNLVFLQRTDCQCDRRGECWNGQYLDSFSFILDDQAQQSVQSNQSSVWKRSEIAVVDIQERGRLSSPQYVKSVSREPRTHMLRTDM